MPHRFLPLLPGFAAGERPLELRRMLSGGKNQTRRHNGLNASLSAAAIGAALRASGLLEAKQALPFSRCVFCSHPSYAARHCQERRRALDLRRMTPGGKSGSPRSEAAQDRLQIFSDSLPAIKGSRTPTDAGLPAALRRSAHPAGRARLSAFHGGSALGTHASQGAVSDQVSRRWLHDGGGLPPAPSPVTASTSHAGHSAGGHDVRYRPSATGTNPLRAGTASRSRQPESPADVLARGARGRRFYSYRAPSQAESFGARFDLIQ